jgi:hypothetical protein
MGGAHSPSIHWQTLFTEDWHEGWMHSGVVELSDQRLVFEASGGGALLFLTPSTNDLNRVTVPVAAAHAIVSVIDKDGECLWICDPGAEPPGQVIKISLSGDVLESIKQPIGSSEEIGKWRPTSIAIDKAGNKWVADGYGLSLLHCIRESGEIETFDGSASGQPFDCPHGVAIAERNGTTMIVVADRANKRLVYLDTNGNFLRNVQGELITSPSSIVAHDNFLYVTDLFSTIIEVDKDDNIRALVPSKPKNENEGWPNTVENGEVVGPLLSTGAMNSPHGISISRSGEILFTDWCLGGRVVRLTP